MPLLKIALLQMSSCGSDPQANLQKGDAWCRRAKDVGADVALFPEMWSIGYERGEMKPPDSDDNYLSPVIIAGGRRPFQPSETQERAREQYRKRAVSRDGAFVSHFRQLAAELEMAIAITYLEEWPAAPRNSMTLFDRHGAHALTYAKVHTCDFDEPESSLTPGDGFPVCALDTAAGLVNVGAMICFDREFPESARILMLNGAEIVLVPNACGLEINRLAQLRTRSYENLIGIAMTNYATPQNNGHSIAFDGVVTDAAGDREILIVEAGEAEELVVVPFDLDALRDCREREVWGNAFRRPHRYGKLVENAILPPFARIDAEGNRYRTELR